MAVEVARDARRALLSRLIDHAPMFPPARLPVREALAAHRRARASDAAWLVDRFVCPATRLAELGHDDLRLSVVLDADVPLEDPRIEAVEVPPGRTPPSDLPEVYVELAPDGDLDALVAAGNRAKVRCGGTAVPSVEELAAFVRGCRERELVFKATAGLHHPVRSDEQHGFLNLLAACVFDGDEADALADGDPAAFELGPDRFSWRDRSAEPAELARVRGVLFAGFGSCSFEEPVADLRALGFLPA